MIAADTLDRLRSLLGERLQTTAAAREHHARDESGHPASLPDAVVFAESTADVAAILRLASQCRLPVVPFGTGTGIEGASIPVRGGLSLDLSRMNRVLEVNVDDLDACVEAGERDCARKAFQTYLELSPKGNGADYARQQIERL